MTTHAEHPISSASRAPVRVLVVDDEPDLRTLYELTLVREGYAVDTAATVGEAGERLQQHSFDAVITDMRLPDGTGLALLQWMQAQGRRERSVVITAHGSTENAVNALKAGAFDYLTKPVDLRQFRSVTAAAVAASQAQGGTHTGKPGAIDPARSIPALPLAQAAHAASALEALVGQSPAMQAVKQRIARVAPSMAPVLVRGESGTGKELVARALHALSHRQDAPWVAVNCSAIPDTLLEAEFFGVRRGAYTGATQDRPGFFQAAAGGTLFLDEIGELPLAMQAKLLRAIQERRVRPLGSAQEEPVDVRIVSATHRDLAADVAAGRFRHDLYFRLNVIEVFIAPLRERREDLALLCDALLLRLCTESGRTEVPPLSEAARQYLAMHPLPGNVRELENLLHGAVAMMQGTELLLQDFEFAARWPAECPEPAAPVLGPSLQPTPVTDVEGPHDAAMDELPADLQSHLDEQERRIVLAALRANGFNRTAAAQRLGMTLRQMRYRIDRLGIVVPGEGSDCHDAVRRP
jgi:two-component system, NtrC family, response regulator PilR